VSGSWHVGSGSVVGYRVQEVLVGQNSTAVGRTSEVWGGLTISGSKVTAATFDVNMASVKSDQAGRNAQFDGRIMDVSAYPTATFKLTQPIVLGTLPAPGKVKKYDVTGDLTMYGTTRKISFTVSAERTSAMIYVLAEINIVFADWNIQNQSVGGFVTTQNHGILEVLLRLTKGAGNRAYSSGESSSTSAGPVAGGFAGGAGGPAGGPQVAVPRTKVPPLTVPSG
jgi:polyisoprenoid-binding protein YceI